MKHTIMAHAAPAVLAAVILFGQAAKGAAVAIDYSLAGTGDVIDGTDTTLTLAALASGSVTSNNPAQSAGWNPVSYSDVSVLDLNTGLLNGTFTITFADGATLTGSLSEDDTSVLQDPSQTGPFTQILIFTGGTNEFVGATGLASGLGFVGATGFSVAGSGTLNTSAVPEPASAILVFGGLAVFVSGAYRRPAKVLCSASEKASCGYNRAFFVSCSGALLGHVHNRTRNGVMPTMRRASPRKHTFRECDTLRAQQKACAWQYTSPALSKPATSASVYVRRAGAEAPVANAQSPQRGAIRTAGRQALR